MVSGSNPGVLANDLGTRVDDDRATTIADKTVAAISGSAEYKKTGSTQLLQCPDDGF